MLRSLAFLAVTLPVLGACNALDALTPPEPVRMLITGVSVRPLDRADADGITRFFYTDTLHTQLAFEVTTHARRLDDAAVGPISGNAHGDDPLPGVIVNPTVPSLSWLSFDRPILHRGSAIAAHTNLLAVERIAQSFDGSRLDLSFPQLSPFVLAQIHLREEAFVLPLADYRIALRWETAEGEIFADTVQVHIRVGEASPR